MSEVIVDDGIHWPAGSVVSDYKTDAAVFLKQQDAEAAAKKKDKEDKEPVAELDSVLHFKEEDAYVETFCSLFYAYCSIL